MDKKEEKLCKEKCKVFKRLVLISTVAMVTAVAVYQTIQEVQRKKDENELLSYEVW